MDATESLGTRIKRLRKAAKLSQYGLERKSGVQQRSISWYERDRSVPNYLNGKDLAMALGVSVHYLYTGADEVQGALPPEIAEIVRRGVRSGMWVDDFNRMIDMYLLARSDLSGPSPRPLE